MIVEAFSLQHQMLKLQVILEMVRPIMLTPLATLNIKKGNIGPLKMLQVE